MDRPSSRTGKAPARRGLAFWRPGSWHPFPGAGSGFLLGQLLALAFLAACLWRVLSELAFVLPADRVTASLSVQRVVGGVLAGRLLAFAAALLLCHALLGAAAWALARLPEVAQGGRRIARRGLLVFAWFGVLVALVLAANATWHPSSMFAAEESWLLHDLGGLKPVTWAFGVFGAGLAWLAARAMTFASPPRMRAALASIAVALLALVVTVALPPARAGIPAAPSGPAPHVVIIGIDSLRAELADE